MRKRVLAVVPVTTDVIWTIYFMFNYLLGRRTLTYQVPMPLPSDRADWLEQVLLLVTVMLWFVAVIHFMITKLERGKIAVGILILACLPEIAVGLTPTLPASILRTMIYLYMAMILFIVIIIEEERDNWSAVEKVFLQFCMIVGVILNACQISRHILLYG